MSKEYEVPHELAAFESKLQAACVSGSKINRDQLLYDAGWAAATAQHTVGISLRRHWAWPAATGVLATLAASLALLLFQQYGLNYRNDSADAPTLAKRSPSDSAADILVEQPAETPKTAIQFVTVPSREVEAPAETGDSRNVSAGASTSRTIPKRLLQSGLRTSLTSRLQFQNFDWEVPPRTDWIGSSSEYTSKTNFEATQELLREFLPEHEFENMSQPQLPIWKWFSQNWREVL